MNIRDLSALERTAVWLDEAVRACRKGDAVYSANPNLTADVIRKAKALRTSLNTLRSYLIPNEQEHRHVD